MVFSGTSPDGRLVEIIEIPKNDFFIACQFHPEFLSRPNRPQPIFKSFCRSGVELPTKIIVLIRKQYKNNKNGHFLKSNKEMTILITY